MSRQKPDSRAAQVRQAQKTLRGLLRTPKTRPGLIAAVVGKSISRSYVFGWLTEQVRSGQVVALKSSSVVTYQNATDVVIETPSQGEFPTWLEPRFIPATVQRRAYLDGRRVDMPNLRNRKK